MAEQRQLSKPEIAVQKKEMKFAPAIGDWTTYKPLRVVVKKIKTGLYGFDRLSKDEMGQMLNIHYRFMANFLKRLRIDLGLAAQLYSCRIEQTTYLNFLRNITGSMLQCKISWPDTHETVLFLLELPLANSLVNYALGSVDIENINRGLTETEKEIVIKTLSEYLPSLANCFAKAFDNLSLSIVSCPDVIIDPTIAPASTFTSFIAETALADNPPGKIYFGYCGQTIKYLLDKFKQRDLAKTLDVGRLPNALLAAISAKLSATLGETYLTTNELHQLEPGDVVSFETSVEDAICAKLGNSIKLSAQPGTKNGKTSIKILGLKDRLEYEITQPVQTFTPPPKTTEPKPVATPPLPAKLPNPAPPPPAAPPKPKKEPLPTEDFLDDFEDDEFSDDEFADDNL